MAQKVVVRHEEARSIALGEWGGCQISGDRKRPNVVRIWIAEMLVSDECAETESTNGRRPCPKQDIE